MNCVKFMSKFTLPRQLYFIFNPNYEGLFYVLHSSPVFVLFTCSQLFPVIFLYLLQRSYRQVSVKLKDFSRTSKKNFPAVFKD